ncbi:hypothetical protein HUG17_4950 [Dermatophagoides farinae]|uniref:Reverse transcriptase domain-containing protein n=1 Tax=Dermatophagoides farinae TaxID=6954 RepID=A0A9D4SI15_DERFA|nr:hypothetical protein HUG17_4950 [Dermatophagoides farinae]
MNEWINKTPISKNDIPIYKIVNSIKSFKDNVAEWPAFKSRVESLIIERKNISESSKESSFPSWKALSKEFEDPELINMYIQSMILKMTNVKDKYDTDGLGRLKRKLKNLRMPLEKYSVLWKNQSNQLMIMQMIVLPFGVISAPAILTQVVSTIINNMSLNSRSILENSMYMDDLLAVSHSESLLLNVIFRKEFATIQDKDWDDDLDEEIVSKINDLTIGLNELNEIKFVRYVEDLRQVSCFVDASS